MATSHLIFAALISLSSLELDVDCLASTEDDASSLQYIYAFFRHGIRTPLYKPYPNDPNTSKYHKYLPGPPGQLTKIGKQIMYKVGHHLKSMYGDFLGEFADENVHISATAKSRTIMTALTIMAGLFPPSTPILDHLAWQPVPVWQDSTQFDGAYLFNDVNFPELAMKVCPKYGVLLEEGNNIINNPDKHKKHQLLYEILQNYTGKSDVNSIQNHLEIWDTLQFESLNGLPLPSWAEQPQSQFGNKSLYPHLMQPIMVQWYRDAEYLKRNNEMLQFYSGPLLDSVYTHMMNKVKNPGSAERMRLHSTHDTTLFVILWALGLTEPKTVEPGDGIIFQLHNLNNTSIVKVKYYHTSHHHHVRDVQLPLCPDPCSLEQLMKTIPGINYDDWLLKCQE